MKIFAVFAVVLICLVAQAKGFPSPANESKNIPAEAVVFGPTGVKTVQGKELLASPAFGDLSKGKHATFIKFPANTTSVTHIHTEDYYAVVISGVGANGKPGSKDVSLKAGSYWFQKGNEPHITKCLSDTECIFFISQPGKFDYVAK